jgi:hypothetical protein
MKRGATGAGARRPPPGVSRRAGKEDATRRDVGAALLTARQPPGVSRARRRLRLT